MATLLGSGNFQYEVDVAWGKLPDGWTYKEAAAVGVDGNDNVYVFSRGDHPMIVFDRHGDFLRSVGRGPVRARPRRYHGAGRVDLLHRRRRPYGSQVHLRRQGAAAARPAGSGGGDAQRQAVQPLHPHRPVPGQRRHLRGRRLRQLVRAQVRPERQAALLVGRGGHRPWPVQHRTQHLHRQRGLRVCGRPREPPRAGVRPQRQVRKRRGATCTAPAACSWTVAATNCATSANWARAWR